jgi:putative ABC transport system permease protein
MIASDLKFAVRNITRQKVQSVISILGLGIGLGCILLLLALILHETSFNKNIPDHNNVYRVVFGNSGVTQYPLAEEMKREFPEVKDFFRFYQTNNIQLRNQKNELVRDQYFGFSDPYIYKILGIKIISGTAALSLTEVAISEKTALKYFGNLSPLGAIIPVILNDSTLNLVVSGVYKNFPSNSTLFPDFISDIKLSEIMFRQWQRSLGDYGNENSQNLGWRDSEFLSFVVLDTGTSIESLTQKMLKYKELISNETTKEWKYSLQPLSRIYMESEENSIMISVPASVYIMSEWMNRFAYKTELSWWIFALAGLSAVLIALITVSWQSWRAATRNPVEALRYE